jgi:uncharacterized protein YndB with AHSA1/START domain
MAFTFHIQIEAPPETVFDELSHVERHPSWANPKAEMTMEKVSEGDPRLGATYRMTGLFVKRPVHTDVTIVAFDPPRRFSIRSDERSEGKKDLVYLNEFTLTAVDGGTRLAKRASGGGSAIVGFLAYPAIRQDVMTSLKSLKRLVESAKG